MIKFKWAVRAVNEATLIDRSQKPFQVRELSSRQMALADQNKELKEENDR